MVEKQSDASASEASSQRIAAQYAAAARQHAAVARQYAATARTYADSARGGASQYREAAREWAGPRADIARERVARARRKDEPDKRGVAKLAAAVRGALPARLSPAPKTSPLDRAKSQGGSAISAVRGRVKSAPKKKNKKRSPLFLLLGLGSGAAAGYKAWSGRKQKDEWDLPTYPSSNATVTSRDQAPRDSGSERTVTDKDRTIDLPGDPTKDDGTAASTSPAAVRSDEGPGISDTDSAARRTQAGNAGGAGFDRPDGPEGHPS